jgi:hypothetical protein
VPPATPLEADPQTALLTPSSAWRILCHRTGIAVSRASFYRWLANGKVFSYRMGHKLFVPVPILEEIIKNCRSGEKL